MNDKILVTGGAGYIGSTLVPVLLNQGNAVTVLDSLIFNQSSLLDCCANSNFEFIQGDICDFDLVNDLLSKSDIVIPLAAIVGAPACRRNPYFIIRVDCDTYINILQNVSVDQKVIFPVTNSKTRIVEKDRYFRKYQRVINKKI